jgi:hypothetical protein
MLCLLKKENNKMKKINSIKLKWCFDLIKPKESNSATLTGWAVEYYWYDGDGHQQSKVISPLFFNFNDTKEWLLSHVPTSVLGRVCTRYPVTNTIVVNSLKDLLPLVAKANADVHHFGAVYIENERTLLLIGQTIDNLYTTMPNPQSKRLDNGIRCKIIRHSVQIDNQFLNIQKGSENYELLFYTLQDGAEYEKELDEYWEKAYDYCVDEYGEFDQEMADEMEPSRDEIPTYANIFFKTKEQADQYLRSIATQIVTWKQYCQHFVEINNTSNPLLVYIDNGNSWDTWNQGKLFKIMPNETWHEASWYSVSHLSNEDEQRS